MNTVELKPGDNVVIDQRDDSPVLCIERVFMECFERIVYPEDFASNMVSEFDEVKMAWTVWYEPEERIFKREKFPLSSLKMASAIR